jgi:TonB family protein
MKRIVMFGLMAGSLVRAAPDCQPKYVAAPRYPVLAFQARVSGEVRVELTVRPDGVVDSLRYEGDKIFRAASETAGKSWKFSPGEERRCSAVMVYRIMPRGTSLDELTTRFEPPLTVEVRRETAEPTVLIDPAPAPAKRK